MKDNGQDPSDPAMNLPPKDSRKRRRGSSPYSKGKSSPIKRAKGSQVVDLTRSTMDKPKKTKNTSDGQVSTTTLLIKCMSTPELFELHK